MKFFGTTAVRRGLDAVHPAPPGERHTQAVSLAASLAARGVPPQDVFRQLRGMYPPDVTDGELRGVVNWTERGQFSRGRTSWYPPIPFRRTHSVASAKPINPVERIASYLRGTIVEHLSYYDLLAELHEASPWRPPDDWTQDSAMLIAGAYEKDECINIVAESNADGGPGGRGLTLTRHEWLKKIMATGTPLGPNGVWVRMNPTDGEGIADTNITRLRFALLEIDTVPLELQLALFSRLPLPIAALITSGGRSVHAWVNVGAKDIETYRGVVSKMLDLLAPFGCDKSNKNPSRLARLPGANRPSSKSEDKRQRLLYFAPDRRDSQPIL